MFNGPVSVATRKYTPRMPRGGPIRMHVNYGSVGRQLKNITDRDVLWFLYRHTRRAVASCDRLL